MSCLLLWKLVPLAQRLGMALICRSFEARPLVRSSEPQLSLFKHRAPVLAIFSHSGEGDRTNCDFNGLGRASINPKRILIFVDSDVE